MTMHYSKQTQSYPSSPTDNPKSVIADSMSASETQLSPMPGESTGNGQPERDRFLLQRSWDNTREQMRRIVAGFLT